MVAFGGNDRWKWNLMHRPLIFTKTLIDKQQIASLGLWFIGKCMCFYNNNPLKIWILEPTILNWHNIIFITRLVYILGFFPFLMNV